MDFDTPQSWAPDLESAIDRHPLTVLPTTPLNQAIALLCQTQIRTCLGNESPSIEPQAHASCLLVVKDRELVGILTERDVVRLTAVAYDFDRALVADVMTSEVIQAPLNTSLLELAKLMSAHRVSCVVITQLDSENNLSPVGIGTERDIIQFQGVQIDLLNTQAQTVMSTPLFLLNPEDSLWVAHQEMQQRRVGRLVVSWNWGRGLGIVTQSSLLKAFDPIEMYGVIENLRQTIEQLELERDNRTI
jgi:CBS domain-containing protein